MQDDIETMRRLLRDLFMQQMILQKQVEELAEPQHAQGSSLVDAAAAGALTRRWRSLDSFRSAAPSHLRHKLSCCGGAAKRCGRADNALAQIQPGPELHTRADVQLGQAAASLSVPTLQSGAAARLWQVQLRRHIGGSVTAVAAPAGARFCDIASPLHGSQGAHPVVRLS